MKFSIHILYGFFKFSKFQDCVLWLIHFRWPQKKSMGYKSGDRGQHSVALLRLENRSFSYYLTWSCVEELHLVGNEYYLATSCYQLRKLIFQSSCDSEGHSYIVKIFLVINDQVQYLTSYMEWNKKFSELWQQAKQLSPIVVIKMSYTRIFYRHILT